MNEKLSKTQQQAMIAAFHGKLQGNVSLYSQHVVRDYSDSYARVVSATANGLVARGYLITKATQWASDGSVMRYTFWFTKKGALALETLNVALPGAAEAIQFGREIAARQAKVETKLAPLPWNTLEAVNGNHVTAETEDGQTRYLTGAEVVTLRVRRLISLGLVEETRSLVKATHAGLKLLEQRNLIAPIKPGVVPPLEDILPEAKQNAPTSPEAQEVFGEPTVTSVRVTGVQAAVRQVMSDKVKAEHPQAVSADEFFEVQELLHAALKAWAHMEAQRPAELLKTVASKASWLASVIEAKANPEDAS